MRPTYVPEVVTEHDFRNPNLSTAQARIDRDRTRDYAMPHLNELTLHVDRDANVDRNDTHTIANPQVNIGISQFHNTVLLAQSYQVRIGYV